MGENLTETVGQVKESVVESINGMANSLNEVIGDGMTKIPLKDASSSIEEAVESQNHLIEENLENLKNEMLSKAQSVGDEADKIADELIKDTEDVIRDAETGITDMKNSAIESVETMKENVMDVIKGNDVMSVDSLGKLIFLNIKSCLISNTNRYFRS
jgi:ABC-type transporter Mla subunit MlaD